jgi:hypothetical protein
MIEFMTLSKPTIPVGHHQHADDKKKEVHRLANERTELN